jgi:hypothetical protein
VINLYQMECLCLQDGFHTVAGSKLLVDIVDMSPCGAFGY